VNYITVHNIYYFKNNASLILNGIILSMTILNTPNLRNVKWGELIPIDQKFNLERSIKNSILECIARIEDTVTNIAYSSHLIEVEDLNKKIGHKFLDEELVRVENDYFYWRNTSHLHIDNLINEQKEKTSKEYRENPVNFTKITELTAIHIASHEYAHHFQKLIYKNGELKKIPSIIIERQAIFLSGIFFCILNPNPSDDDKDYLMELEASYGDPENLSESEMTHGTGKQRKTYFLDGLQAWEDTKNIGSMDRKISGALKKALDIIPKEKAKPQDSLLKTLKEKGRKF
jgi:hypothetical protein